MSNGLSVLQGAVLDMVAEGKSPRQISEVIGVSPAEAAKMAYDLLDAEIVTNAEQRRNLQVYRLEKIVEALWKRTMESAQSDDVKNLLQVLEQLNTLLALNKEQDSEMILRMEQHQLGAYVNALKGLIVAFQILAPDLMTPEQWAAWSAQELEVAQNKLTYEIEA